MISMNDSGRDRDRVYSEAMRFETTRWSMVLAASDGDSTEALGGALLDVLVSARPRQAAPLRAEIGRPLRQMDRATSGSPTGHEQPGVDGKPGLLRQCRSARLDDRDRAI